MANEKAMQNAPVWKLLLSMSLPMILVMTVNVLYNMADVFFMGRTGETLQVTAISLAGPVFSALSAFNTLIGFGGCTAVSISLGKGEQEEVRKYSAFVVYASLLLSLALMVTMLLGMNALLPLLGTNTETRGYTASYLKILALGSPFMLVGGALGNTIRADGDSRGAVLASLLGTGINLGLDPLFISVFRWGIRGAAWATVCGNMVSCVLLIILAGRKDAFSISLRDFTLSPDISLRILGLGLPMAAGTLLMSFSSVFFNRLMVNYGNLAVAARSVSGKIGMLIPMIIMGVCMGIQPAVSYVFGTGDRKRMRSILLGTGLASTLIATVMAVTCFLLRDVLVASFITDAEVVALGEQMMLSTVISAPVYGIYQLCTTYLQGTGKVSFATLSSLLRQGLVYVPVLYIMDGLLGLMGLIYASAVTDLISTIISVVLCLLHANQLQGMERHTCS